MINTPRERALNAARQAVNRLPTRVQRPVRSGAGRLLSFWLKRDPLVSVVVPVYGVERYLPACLDSLLEQSFPNLQIITVDDGSPDRSIDILEAYAKRDRRIEIVRQANAGLGAARNTGARHARGDFLMFIDSDDTLQPDAIRAMVRALRRTGSDFVVATYQRMSAAGFTPPAWWIRTAHRFARLAVDLHSFPDIQVNAVAWSKLYRRRFWESNHFEFPVGVLYEDQAVSSRAYVLAHKFDVLSKTLINWRVRDDRSSISQQIVEVADLRARLEAASNSLAELDRPGFERPREVRLAQYLSNDFPQSIRAAQHADDEFWHVLRDGLRKLTDRATPFVWERVSAQHRIATELVIEDKRTDVEWFVGLDHNNPKRAPSVAHQGKLYLDTPVRHALGLEVTDPMLAFGEHQLDLVTATRRASWTADGQLEIEGWAYIDNLDLGEGVTPELKAWMQEIDGPARVAVTVEQRSTTEVTAASKHRYSDYEKSGFVLHVDPDALRAAAPDSERQGWQVMLEVRAARLTRRGLLRGIDWTGSAGRLTTYFFSSGRTPYQAIPRFSGREGLAVEISRVRCFAERISLQDRVLHLELHGTPEFTPQEVELTDTTGDQVLRETLERGSSGSSSIEVRLPTVPSASGSPGPRIWQIRVISLAGTKSPLAVLDGALLDRMPPAGPYAHLTAHGNLCVLDEERSVWIDTVAAGPSNRITLGGRAFGVTADRLTLLVATPRARGVSVAEPTGDNTFRAVVPLDHDPWQLGTTVLPSGAYTLEAIESGPAATAPTGPAIPVRADDALLATLPLDFATPTLRGQFRISRPDGLAIVLEPPLADDERGARHQQRMQLDLERRRSDPDFEYGAVLFRSYYGEVAACNPQAVHEELRRRGTKHKLYWAVKDYSVKVPDGGIPVIYESAEWYRLLHDAHFYMDNMHQALYHVKPPHQVQVQTFHGYPFKQMGISHWTWQNRDKVHVQSYLDRAADWDYLVSPATYGTKALCEEFGFPNQVLEIGYPRNDVLLGDRTPELTAEVRARLGIRPDQTAVLYGPTFRDEMAQNDFKALMVDFLDIPRLAAALGDQYVVLVRGHAFNARVDARVGSRGNVIDVTDYPDIAHLCLASDAAILDYSSLRFDYGITGKPMIFLVPDLEQYQENSRGSLFAYEPTAPGPLLRNTAQVVEAVKDLDAVRRDYAEAYAQFKADFLDLDDGHASERLVDLVFTAGDPELGARS